MLARGAAMEIEYELSGRAGEAVVLIPALGADRTMWQPQIDELSPAYMVICCETGGNRPISPRASPRLEDFADVTRAVLDAVGVVRAHVVGLSMGGMVAQLLAARYPERVESLVLVSTVAAYPEDRRHQMRERARLVRAEGMRAIADATVRRWLSPGFLRSHASACDTIRAMLLRADPEAYAAAATAVSAVNLMDILPRIAAPTLVLRGAMDGSIDAATVETLATTIPTASAEQMEDAAHLCNFDAAHRFNHILVEHIHRTGASHRDAAFEPHSPW